MRLAESTLRLSGMYCAACAGTIEHALAGVDGVRTATVSATTSAAVRWDPQHAAWLELVAAIRRAGYDAAPTPRRRRASCAGPRAAGAVAPVRRGLLHDAGDDAGHAVVRGRCRRTGADVAQLLNWSSWVLSLPVLLFSAAPFFQGHVGQPALAPHRHGRARDLGISVAFIASTGATFDPGGLFGRRCISIR